MDDSARVTLKFDGQHHQVDIDLYTTVLLDYARVVREVNREVNPNTNINIKIDATGEGSLDAFLSLTSSITEGTIEFATTALGGIASIVAIAGGLYSIRKAMAEKGKPTEVIENNNNEVVLTHSDGNTTIIDKRTFDISIKNIEINNALDHTFSSLSENESSLTGLEMRTGDDVLFSTSSQFFSAMAQPPTVENEGIQKIIDYNAVLGVTRVILECSMTRRWEFVVKGNKIAANITDMAFLESLSEHSFAIGDNLIVDLEITQIQDEKSKLWFNKSYTVLKVHAHNPRSTTMPFME
jgi:hypothetical protein